MTRRVLIARLDSMGDVLLAGPAVRAVAQDAKVIFLCGPRGAQAAELLPGVSELLVWDAPWISNPAPAFEGQHFALLVAQLRAAEIAEAIILTSFHQSPLPLAMALRLAGVGQITGASVDYAGSLLDVRLRPGEDLPEDIPEAHRAMMIAAAAGYPSDDDQLRVRPLPDTTSFTGAGGYVVMHPGASAPARMWPLDEYVRAAQMLLELGHRVIVTGSADEGSLTRRVSERAPGVIDLAGSCTLAELGSVLAGASVVVVGNTGPAHLAAAVGTPVVSLFSPVVPAIRWAPHGVPLKLLGDQTAPCKNTRARECPIADHPCLSRVCAEEVVRAVLDVEAEAVTRRSHEGALA